MEKTTSTMPATDQGEGQSKVVELAVGNRIGEGGSAAVYVVESNGRSLALKLYRATSHSFSIVKNVVLLEAFRDFSGGAPRLEMVFAEGIGFPVEDFPKNAFAVLQTRVEGRPLAEFDSPMSVEEISGHLGNVIAQLKFVAAIESQTVADIATRYVPRDGGIRIPVGYHGDISDTSLVLGPNGGALVDFDACLSKELDDLTVHPTYGSPEAWNGEATDEGLNPQMCDFYSIAAVTARMLLGREEFSKCLDEKPDERRQIDRVKIRRALKQKGMSAGLTDAIFALLSDVPGERILGGATTGVENYDKLAGVFSGSS